MNGLVEKLVLGTVQLGMQYGINNSTGQPSAEAASDILRAAHRAGITTLDTADAYGTAMERIGRFHATSGNTFRIITKFHADETTNVLEKIPQTLTNLGVSSLTCYQFHRFSDVSAFPHIHAQLRELKARRLIERVGVSVYSNAEFRAAAESTLIDVIQFPYNILDNMHQRGSTMRFAKERGKELHTRSVFLQGLLFKPFDEFPPQLMPLLPYLQRLHKLQESSNFAYNGIHALALNYVLHNPLIDAVLFGVETVSQLAELLAAVHPNFNEDVMRVLDAIAVEETDLLNPVNWK